MKKSRRNNLITKTMIYIIMAGIISKAFLLILIILIPVFLIRLWLALKS